MSTSNELFRDRVRERDLDNFLVEELQASSAFRSWFLSRLPQPFDPPPGSEIRIHKSPQRLQDTRQTDVRLGWFNSEGDLRACVLIESKVTADFQPGQAESYGAEIKGYQIKLGPTRAYGVLIAPRSKLRSLTGSKYFQTTMHIEEIIEFLRHRRIEGLPEIELDARIAARIELLEALAGKRTIASWRPITLTTKRDFANSYAELARLIAPELTVRASTDGPRALTRFFDGLSVDSDFPCAVNLKHEFGDGIGHKYANLQFSGKADRVSALEARGDLFASNEFYTASSAKSLFVRINTPSLVGASDQFEVQRPKIVIGLEAVRKLAEWFEAHQRELKRIFSTNAQSNDADLAPALEAELRGLADRAWRECRYRPSYFLEMLDNRGGLATAHALLNGRPSEGFARLWELKRLDLTVEAFVLNEPWRQLFTDAELGIAERRLKEAGYIE